MCLEKDSRPLLKVIRDLMTADLCLPATGSEYELIALVFQI